jgi:trimethylamine--corrinoid protein Co-methyltransferase
LDDSEVMMDTQSHDVLGRAMALEKQARFNAAKTLYEDLMRNCSEKSVLQRVQGRLEDMADLIAEKEVYRRIDENAKRVLTDIGIHTADNQFLMDLLVEADGIDFDNQTALFIPLRREYIDGCLAKVPRKLAADPGLNTFGTGATSPFLKRTGDDGLRPASRHEFEEIIRVVSENRDVTGIFSLPVACDRNTSLFEIAGMMEKGYHGLKMIPTNTMSDDEVLFFSGKEEWLDGTSLLTSLTPMNTMVGAFMRSARAGNNLLLVDQSLVGLSGPGSPEAILTLVHAHIIFMIVVAQTVTPGISCVHCGIPSIVGGDGTLAYSSAHQSMINAAMARLNTWITGLPTAQTGGSTSMTEVAEQALVDSELSRNLLRKYGVHIVRHALGALDSLNFFSLEKFVQDCERERRDQTIFASVIESKGIIPLYFPTDDHALEGIREIAEKGNPKSADHTLRNVDSFSLWEERIKDATTRKLYYPQLNDMVIDAIGKRK